MEDDLELVCLLTDFLAESGVFAEHAADGDTGLKRMVSEDYDLAVLDVTLPKVDGFEVLHRLREVSSLPVLMLTAKGERHHRLMGLENGADDYMVKPFDPDELLARVRAIVRRVRPARSPVPLEAGDLKLLPGTREAFYRGAPLGLTAMECEVLEQLMRSAGRAVTRDQLSMQLYGRLQTPYDRSLDTHITRIRRKLRQGRGLILSVRGSGYQLRTTEGTE